ncbi:MAG: aminoacyl-tRNA hydrolase [Gammaproteobacteria bacterium]|nr:aminoacyl-tRNA hydrolase [Gammaproteobacteria bacterium]
MLIITPHVRIPLSEIEIHAVRSQGAGGQNVNKVASAIHLRFNIRASSLADVYKQRLLMLNDQRITNDGAIVIKAQAHRGQEQNKQAALQRLAELIKSVTLTRKKRRATKPSRSAKKKRVDAKNQRGKLKTSRRRVGHVDD